MEWKIDATPENYQKLETEVMAKAGEKIIDLTRTHNNEIASDPDKQDWEYIEYEPGFLGFLYIYDAVRNLVPRNWAIVDLGSYCAAQGALFSEHALYVSVNRGVMPHVKFDNSIACPATDIRDVVAAVQNKELSEVFAICSYVPDFEAVEAAKEVFPNIAVYYPGRENFCRINEEVLCDEVPK